MNVLDRFEGLTLAEARKELADCEMLLLMSDDEDLVHLAKEHHRCGVNVAVAGIVAKLCIKTLGIGETATRAVDFYKAAIASHEHGPLKEVQYSLNSLEEWLAWSSACRGRMSGKRYWPVKSLWRGHRQRCGLANIMLWYVALELQKSPSTTDMLAIQGIVQFLKDRKEYCRRKGLIDGRGKHEES
jgi:hypothetical protein